MPDPTVTLDDVVAALRAVGRPELADPLPPGAAGLLDEAVDLIAGYLHPAAVPSPTPRPIRRVAGSMVAAVLIRPASIPPEATQLQADVFGASFAPGTTSLGPYLTAGQKQRLRPYRPGVVSVELGSERAGT